VGMHAVVGKIVRGSSVSSFSVVHALTVRRTRFLVLCESRARWFAGFRQRKPIQDRLKDKPVKHLLGKSQDQEVTVSTGSDGAAQP
jgi:hypothetical protein